MLNNFPSLKKKAVYILLFSISFHILTYFLRCLLMFDRKPDNQKHKLDVEWMNAPNVQNKPTDSRSL